MSDKTLSGYELNAKLLDLGERFVAAYEKQATGKSEPRVIDVRDEPKSAGDGSHYRHKLVSGAGYIKEVIHDDYLELFIVSHNGESQLILTTKGGST